MVYTMVYHIICLVNKQKFPGPESICMPGSGTPLDVRLRSKFRALLTEGGVS